MAKREQTFRRAARKRKAQQRARAARREERKGVMEQKEASAVPGVQTSGEAGVPAEESQADAAVEERE